MKILAIEFASEQRSVAIVVDGEPRGTAAESGGRNTRSCGLIERALQQAGIEREMIDCIAVGLGPGSYTGIRAAISVAQGWQLARGAPLLGLSTVECLAAQAQSAGMTGLTHIAIDAQRGEFYLACYEISPDKRRLVEALHLANKAEVEQRAGAGPLLVWPGLRAVFPQGRVLMPEASMLGQLAAERTDFVPGEKLEPIYLRQTAFVKAAPPRFIPTL